MELAGCGAYLDWPLVPNLLVVKVGNCCLMIWKRKLPLANHSKNKHTHTKTKTQCLLYIIITTCSCAHLYSETTSTGVGFE